MIRRVTDPSRKTFNKFLWQHGPSSVMSCLAKMLMKLQAPSSRILPSLVQKSSKRDFLC
jgi:hypothetical protein